MTYRPSLTHLCLAIVVGASLACAGVTTSSHVQTTADFRSYHTFDWGPRDALPVSDARLEQDAFYRDHIEGGVEKQLGSRGLERATADAADLLVHYHTNVRSRMETDLLAAEAGSQAPRLMPFEQSTLVVDVVDARTGQLVWRGWAQDIVRFEDPTRVHRQIEEGVNHMFKRFPLALAAPPADTER